MAWFQKKPQAGAAARLGAAGQPIHECLNERAILLPSSGIEKSPLLELLVEAACAAHDLGDLAPLLARVRERESGISTTLDTGLSLPHARVDGLKRISAALAVTPFGVVDPQQAQIKIRATFLFFSPNRPESYTQHLQVLRGVAALFRTEVIDELGGLKSPAAILARLREREA